MQKRTASISADCPPYRVARRATRSWPGHDREANEWAAWHVRHSKIKLAKISCSFV